MLSIVDKASVAQQTVDWWSAQVKKTLTELDEIESAPWASDYEAKVSTAIDKLASLLKKGKFEERNLDSLLAKIHEAQKEIDEKN